MFLLIMLLTWPPESAILFVNLSLWKEIPGRDIHWSPVAGLSGCGTHVLCTGKYFYLKEIDITLARIYIFYSFLDFLNYCWNSVHSIFVHQQIELSRFPSIFNNQPQLRVRARERSKSIPDDIPNWEGKNCQVS